MLVMLALLPGVLKRAGYRTIFGYRIGRNVRIGLAILDCAELTIGDDTRIGHGVVLWRCGEVKIGAQVVIGMLNLFRGGESIQLEDYAMVMRLNVINAIIAPDFDEVPRSIFRLGWGSIVTAEHRIDFTAEVSIGRQSILGGRNSSIWTHNRRHGRGVRIGDYCYVGSEIRMAPGSAIPSRSIVGLGSVVTGALDCEDHLIGGVPARPLRPLDDEDRALIFDPTRRDLPIDMLNGPFLASDNAATKSSVKSGRESGEEREC